MTQLDFFTVLEMTIDKWSLTFDELMALPDTPDIAARRNVRLPSLWAQIGMRRAVAA